MLRVCALAVLVAACPAQRVCGPGEMQLCNATSTCIGERSCNPDGLAFGPCKCGGRAGGSTAGGASAGGASAGGASAGGATAGGATAGGATAGGSAGGAAGGVFFPGIPMANPPVLDFGDVYVGESRAMTFTLSNVGAGTFVVAGAVLQTDAGFSGDAAVFNGVAIFGGGAVGTMFTFAPSNRGAASGVLSLTIDADGGLIVPLRGRGVEAVPRLCFRFDNSPMETCTDALNTSLSLQAGALTMPRSGRLYLRNEGNTPVPYSMLYRPYPYAGSRCDAGAPASDFVFSNVPVPDGGAPGQLNEPTTQLPLSAMDPLPWETAPIAIAYVPSARCREEIVDQAQVLWTRQDPVGTVRAPLTLFATLTGSSYLPFVRPKPLNIGQLGQPADVPLTTPISIEGVFNEGPAPVTLTGLQLFEELPAYLPDGGLYDGGGPQGGILQACNPSSPVYEFSDCSRFQWAPPGPMLPVTLDGGSVVSPSQVQLGRMFVGCLADGGSCPPATTRYRIYLRISTTDPFAPDVLVPITAYVRYLP